MRNNADSVIFIIDNSHTYREIVRNCLEALGFQNIHSFRRSEEIAHCKYTPDIVILDHELGNDKLKGLDFFIRFKSANPATHFIFFSSNTKIDIAVEAIKLGAFDYIVKSKIGLDRLMKRISGLIISQVNVQKSRIAFRTALISLSMVGIVFIVAIILYSNQII